MADHNKPVLTDTYSNFLTFIDARLDDLALGLSSSTTTVTNPPTNSIRWNSSNRYWEINSGTPATPTWGALSTSYSININGTVGATTPAAGSFTTISTSGIATLAANSTVGGNVISTVSGTETLSAKTLTLPKINDTSSNHTYNFAVSELTANRTVTLPLLTGNDTFVFEAHTQTLTNKTLTSPRFADLGYIADSNGNELLVFDSVASAVNEVTLANAATGTNPTISATGGDANINLRLSAKGTGVVQVGTDTVATLTATQTLTNKTLTSPVISSISNTGTLTLPTSTDTLVGRATTDTLTNKTLSTSSTWQGNTVAVGYGGTGTATAPTQGGVIYASSTSAYASSAAGTAGQILQSNGTSAPTWTTIDLATNAPGMSYKSNVLVATTADLAASTFAGNVLTGYDDTFSLNVTTTAGNATCTTTSTAGLKIGAVLSGNANIPAARTVTTIVNATTFTISESTGVLAGSAVATTFTQTIAELIVDGVTLALNDRVLVKDTYTLGGLPLSDGAKYNGIYSVTATGSTTAPWTLTRTGDADSAPDLAGAIVAVSRGTANGGKSYKTRFLSTSTLNTTPMYWNRLVDVASSGLYSAPTTAVGVDIATDSETQRYVGGSIADFAVNSFGTKNIQATSASTYTRASTVYIAGAPSADTFVTITTPYALYIAGGNTYMAGTLTTGSTINGLTLSNTSLGSAAATALTVDSGTTGALNLGTGASAKTITIGNSTGATAVDIITGTGNLDITSPTTTMSGDLTVTGGDIATGAAVASTLFNTTTTANITIAGALTTGTFTVGATGSTGAVSLFPATGSQAITLGGATTGTVTIGSTLATAVQLPTGKTKIGNTTLAQGGSVTIILPTLAGTLYASGNTDVALADGGTNASLTATNGGIVYSTATAMAISAAGTSGQVLTSAGASAPVWVTSVPVANGGTGTTTAAQAKINLQVITAATGSQRVPTGTTAQRDGTPGTGYFRFNTSVGKFEGYNGSNWGSVGGGATGGGPDEVFIENSNTVTTNYTITTNRNAMTTGPVTINAGVVVTVPGGSRWVVL